MTSAQKLFLSGEFTKAAASMAAAPRLGSRIAGAAMHGVEGGAENLMSNKALSGMSASVGSGFGRLAQRFGNSRLGQFMNHPTFGHGAGSAQAPGGSVANFANRESWGFGGSSKLPWNYGAQTPTQFDPYFQSPGYGTASSYFRESDPRWAGGKQAAWLKSAIIREEGGKFNLYSHKGKRLGSHPSRAAAIRQEQAIKANGG
jgi:hypothetical protein